MPWRVQSNGATAPGYDHLLFLFGVVSFLTGFRQIVRYVTAFTFGHSVTLILATLLQISANYFLVDAVIALSGLGEAAAPRVRDDGVGSSSR